MKKVEERIKEYEESIETHPLFIQLEKLIDKAIKEGKPSITIKTNQFNEEQYRVYKGIIELYIRKGFKRDFCSEGTILSIF